MPRIALGDLVAWVDEYLAADPMPLASVRVLPLDDDDGLVVDGALVLGELSTLHTQIYLYRPRADSPEWSVEAGAVNGTSIAGDTGVIVRSGELQSLARLCDRLELRTADLLRR